MNKISLFYEEEKSRIFIPRYPLMSPKNPHCQMREREREREREKERERATLLYCSYSGEGKRRLEIALVPVKKNPQKNY
jgi:hypothetical protein